MKIPGLHPNQARALKRRGWQLFDAEDGRLMARKIIIATLPGALASCRRNTSAEKAARYRRSHPCPSVSIRGSKSP